MADVFSIAKRSQVMSRIRSRGNKETELALAKLLRRHGIKGWRRHVQVRIAEFGPRSSSRGNEAQTKSRKSAIVNRKSIGASSRRLLRVRPDFVFLKVRLAVFVDGCFWHGCPKHATQPKNNRAFWRRKLAGNKQRDRIVNRTLRKSGWRVLRIWECVLQKRPKACLHRIRKAFDTSPVSSPRSGRRG
ncbi:MAG TPA: very short patch repair endonuclease [Verrucomicrobiae bacterium]|nr:very short patch repair endonuclease [Verrucomicrobiae bacterium]